MNSESKNHKRKFIIVSASVLGLAAVISTSYAAFMITTGKNPGSANPDVSMDGIQTQGLTVSVNFGQDKLMLEPRKEDTSGKVYWKSGNSEKLNLNTTITVNGDVSLFDTVYIVAESSKKDASKANDLFSSNYLAFDPINLKKTAGVDWTSTGTGSSAVTTIKTSIAFKWGSAFEGQNPGDYFDRADATEDYDTIVDRMNALHDSASNTSIKVTVEAKKSA